MQDSYREWRPTPAYFIDRRERLDDDPPPPPPKLITVEDYLYDWTGEPWPPRIQGMVDGFLASPGNFWCEGRLGYVVVSPTAGLMVYLHYG